LDGGGISQVIGAADHGLACKSRLSVDWPEITTISQFKVRMKFALGIQGFAAIGLLAACVPAHAQTVEILNNYFVGTSKLSAVIPHGPSLTGPVLTSIVNTVYIDVNGSRDGTFRSPWQWTKSADGIEYEPLGKFTSVQANSSGEISFGSDAKTLQLVWGSPDKSNRLEFIDNGITVASVTGGDISGASVGVNFVRITLVGAVFDAVRLSSSFNAFEIGDLSAETDHIVSNE
jgi:hypothetical protein